jgi:tetratricopeptide (TPR) repeat protein
VLRSQGQLAEAEAVQANALAMRRTLLTNALALRGEPSGGEDLDVAKSLEDSALLLMAQGRESEAGPLLRECLAMREKQTRDAWPRHRTQACLGACLLTQKNFPQAEPLLLAGYEGLSQHPPPNPAVAKSSLRHVLGALAQLYSQIGQPDKAAQWKAKLDQIEAGRK